MMGNSAYGRGRSDLGKVHMIDPMPGNRLMAYCSSDSCVRTVAPTDSGIRIIDCETCRKAAERLRSLRTMAEANGGTFSIKADGFIRGLIERGVIQKIGGAGRGGWHAAHYRFTAK